MATKTSTTILFAATLFTAWAGVAVTMTATPAQAKSTITKKSATASPSISSIRSW